LTIDEAAYGPAHPTVATDVNNSHGSRTLDTDVFPHVGRSMGTHSQGQIPHAYLDPRNLLCLEE
jgi:hypothetical protein